MFSSIIRIVHLLISAVTLYVVVMNNQKKPVDFPKGMGTELISSVPDEVSHSSGDGENLLGSNLRMGHRMNSFGSLGSHLMAKNHSNPKPQ